MSTEFAVFLPCTKRFSTLAVYRGIKPIVSAINNLKTMGRRHTVHERQAIISTTVVISIQERERADPQRGVAIITWCYHASCRPFLVTYSGFIWSCNAQAQNVERRTRTNAPVTNHIEATCAKLLPVWSLKMAVQTNVQRNSGLVTVQVLPSDSQTQSRRLVGLLQQPRFVVTHHSTGSSKSQLPSSQADVSAVPKWTWEGVLQRSNLPIVCLCTFELLIRKFYKSQKYHNYAWPAFGE